MAQNRLYGTDLDSLNLGEWLFGTSFPSTKIVCNNSKRLQEGKISTKSKSSGQLAGIWPEVDIYETATAYVIEMDAVGCSPGDGNIYLEIEKNVLHVKINPLVKKEWEKAKYLVKGKPREVVSKKFALMDDADQTKIDASVEHGLLTITIGKKKTSGPKTIKIT